MCAFSEPPPIYAGFLGTWILDPRSCEFEQGPAPLAGSYHIEELEDGSLRFTMQWVDATGARHKATFAGKPDGEPSPFPGGELADAMSVAAVSPTELNSSAYWQGVELMVAQRQLDLDGSAMRLIQLVRLPDGTRPTNVSVYYREQKN